MKLIIDIPDNVYAKVIEYYEHNEIVKAVYSYIYRGIPLDKIKAEIDVARFIDKDTKLCKNANASGLEVAMQIIDKYR